MEACFSQLTLDVIGLSVFNYEFDSLKTDSPLIQAKQPLTFPPFPDFKTLDSSFILSSLSASNCLLGQVIGIF